MKNDKYLNRQKKRKNKHGGWEECRAGPISLHRVDAKYFTSCPSGAQTSRAVVLGLVLPVLSGINPSAPGLWKGGRIPGKGAPGAGG